MLYFFHSWLNQAARCSFDMSICFCYFDISYFDHLISVEGGPVTKPLVLLGVPYLGSDQRQPPRDLGLADTVWPVRGNTDRRTKF